MNDSVEDSGSHYFVTEDSAPIFEVSVRSEDSGLVFVSVSNDFKEVVECLWGKGPESDLVEDKDVGADGLLKDASVGVIGPCLSEPFEQGVEV